jgi:hypothetical protein
MKEFDVFSKKIADGLKSPSEGIEVLADKMETMAKAQRQETTNVEVSENAWTSNPSKVPGSKGTRKVAKMNVPRKPRQINASRRVLAVISASKKGVDTQLLKRKGVRMIRKYTV